jgi:16S rRNA (guanine(966)-N(2))-methyltransferase RsmD
LHSYGLVEGLRYLDLFAGTGSLGLEALSRGADSVVFNDNSELSVNTVTHNLQLLGFEDQAEISLQDAMTYLRKPEDFDVVILDPPYEFELWDQLISQINSNVVVIETSQNISLNAHWVTIKEQSYGQTKVIIAAREISLPL